MATSSRNLRMLNLRATRPERDAAMGLLLACVQSAPQPADDVSKLLSLAPDHVILQLAAFHRVSGFVHERLRSVPGERAALLEVLERRYAQATAQHLRMLWVLSRLLPELKRSGCRWAVVKGPVLVETLYDSHPGRRPYLDLDLLVDPADFAVFLQALDRVGCRLLDRNWIGMRRAMRGEVHVEHADGTLLDVHWNLIDMYRWRMRIPSQEVLSRARVLQIDGQTIETLDPIDTVLHLAFHAAHSGGDRLLWLKDLERAISVSPIDWDAAVSRARAWHIASPVGLMLWRARAVLGANVPTEVTASLLPAPAKFVAEWFDRLWPWQYGFGRTAAPSRLFSRSIGRGSLGAVAWLAWRSIRNLDPHQQAKTSTFAPNGTEADRDRFIRAVIESAEAGHR